MSPTLAAGASMLRWPVVYALRWLRALVVPRRAPDPEEAADPAE